MQQDYVYIDIGLLAFADVTCVGYIFPPQLLTSASAARQMSNYVTIFLESVANEQQKEMKFIKKSGNMHHHFTISNRFMCRPKYL